MRRPTDRLREAERDRGGDAHLIYLNKKMCSSCCNVFGMLWQWSYVFVMPIKEIKFKLEFIAERRAPRQLARSVDHRTSCWLAELRSPTQTTGQVLNWRPTEDVTQGRRGQTRQPRRTGAPNNNNKKAQ